MKRAQTHRVGFGVSGEPGSRCVYFLNKLSNAARASVAFLGAVSGFGSPNFAEDSGKTSRATVTRGENHSHWFA